jgi:hypothetical protein
MPSKLRLWLVGLVVVVAGMGLGSSWGSAQGANVQGVAELGANALGGPAPVDLPVQAAPIRAGLAVTLTHTLYFPFVGKPADWLQFGYDTAHSGVNPNEAVITQANVATLRLGFQVQLRAIADGAPAYLHGVVTPSGLRDLLFVTTIAGHIQALDAHTGQEIWWHQYGPGNCLINNNTSRNESCYTTSSPAIEPDGKYVYSYGLDGFVHKYAVGDGSEFVGGGWPELATRKVYDEKGSSALSIATARDGTVYLYVTNGGYPGDVGNYQGHVTAINLATGAQNVFNTMCSNDAGHFVDSRVTAGPDCWPNVRSAIWARPAVVYDAVNDRILMATGNGTFLPASFLWGDTVFALHPDGTGAGNGQPVDSYTPTNYLYLNNADLDLGSSAPALLPPASGKYTHLAVQSGKDARLRLVDRDNLSGHGASGSTGGEVFSMAVPMGRPVFTQPAVWVNPQDQSTWVFVANDSGITGLQLAIDGLGDPTLVTRWTRTGAAGAGTSPALANGVLFSATSNLITARAPTTGNPLWSNNQIGAIHWASPIVVSGTVYVTDLASHVTAYRLP